MGAVDILGDIGNVGLSGWVLLEFQYSIAVWRE